MDLTLSPYDDGDAAVVVAIRNAVYPGRAGSVAEWARQEAAFDEARHPRRRIVALAAGEVVGYGRAWNTLAPRKYRMEVMVHPERQRRGIGSRIMEQLLVETRALGAVSVQARAGEDQGDVLAFLHRRGFHETHRMISLSLSLSTVDLGALESLAASAGGIQIATLADEQARRPDYLQALCAAHNASLEGWPDPDPDPLPAPSAPQPYEQFLGSLAALRPIPEAFFIACRGNEYLGYSGPSRNEDEPGGLLSAGTAVRAEHRGRGIATTLKVCTVRFAARQGYQEIRTSTANPAMLRVNEKLGFRRRSAEVRMVRRLDGDSSAALT